MHLYIFYVTLRKLKLNLMKRFFILLLAICGVVSLNVATIDTLKINSPKMGREINTLVIVPEVADKEPIPTLYLLHGYSGKESSWMSIRNLRPLADQYGILIVCPNGENSWFWDSPVREDSQFETFISSELPAYIDKNYPTIADRTGRAIAGLSMGGHGAMWNALRHTDIFGAVGSISGGLDIRPFPEKWTMKSKLGAMEQNAQRWDDHAAINAIGDLKNNELAIIIDCGVGDFFIDVNRNFHNALVEKGISHDYIERAGAHTSTYWNNSIIYQIHYFDQYFTAKTKLRKLHEEAAKSGIATIDNDVLRLQINKRGAEMASLKNLESGREAIWSGDPTYWKFRAPVLFPIVGPVNNNKYRLDGKEYDMTIHGIARDYDFDIVKHTQTELVYRLKSTEQMREKYPCDFVLEIGYRLLGNTVKMTYKVVNPSDETIYFQIGAHPGFNYIDYDPEAEVQGYYQFNDVEDNAKLSASMSGDKGYVKPKKSVKLSGKQMAITKDTFNGGALTLENSQTKSVSLLDANKVPYVHVTYDAPVVGLWSQANKNYAPFACIEPWYGRGDGVGYKGEFKDRDWMQSLEGKGTFSSLVSITILK